MAPNKAEFLKSCALALLPDTHCTQLLKSYYMQTSLSVAQQSPVLSQMCPHCCLFWSENEYKLKLSKHENLQKLTRELDKLRVLEEQKHLIKKKRLRMKWLQKQIARLKVECKFCSKISSVSISKPKVKKAIKTAVKSDSKVTNMTITKKKRKRKKDKTAGLKIPVNKVKKETKKVPNSVITKSANVQLKLQQNKLKKSLQHIMQRQSSNVGGSCGLNSLLK